MHTRLIFIHQLPTFSTLHLLQCHYTFMTSSTSFFKSQFQASIQQQLMATAFSYGYTNSCGKMNGCNCINHCLGFVWIHTNLCYSISTLSKSHVIELLSIVILQPLVPPMNWCQQPLPFKNPGAGYTVCAWFKTNMAVD